MKDNRKIKIDEGDYWEMIKECAGASFLFLLLYGFVCLGFCL